MAKVKQTTNGKIKYFEDQFDDEDVLYVFRKHPVVMRKGLVFGMAAWLVGPLYVLILTYTQPNNPPSLGLFGLALLASIVLGSLIFMPWYISWYFSVFIVTDQRFIQITQKGLFKRSVVDMSLNQIQMINYEIAGLQETLLGFGTIMMQTFVGDLVIHDVHHPAKTQKKLVGILREQGVMTSSPPAMSQQLITDEQEN
ncbi:MAG TPA: PH domain-containing protein [Candidatus Saccharimonadales bacterium]|nr:PH domain-containing protein [Candidatus Saccharimonadales bacterium]